MIKINPTGEKFYEKYSWVIFFIIGLIILAGALPHTFGVNTDPALVQSISGQTLDELKNSRPTFFNLYHYYFRGGGLSDLGFAFFLIVISVTAYRQKQKWSWFAFLFVPVYFLSWIFLSSTLPPESVSSLFPPLIIITVLSLFGLILPLKKFFPKQT
ncbi:MAG: DUF603 domain-containing protein [Candidatus Shapirobacteria bacterium]|nr:DUF603 domain-containing protein [Candidatus Shapirobacteria bacterium]